MHFATSGTDTKFTAKKRYFANHTENIRTFSVKRRELKSERVIINISGQMYETFASTLDKYPETLLGTAEKRQLLFDRVTNQIFLERHRAAFDAILFYYQSSGYLARPSNISMDEFEEECIFFDISEEALFRMKQRDCYLHKIRRNIPNYDQYSNFRYRSWIFLDKPMEFGHISAIIYYAFSFFLIIVSIALFCVETEVVDDLVGDSLNKYYLINNNLELALNLYFALELLFRFYVYPFRKEFFKKPINSVETAIVCMYLLCYGLPKSYARTFIINSTRTLRAFRIARFSRCSLIIKSSLQVFQNSVYDVLAVWFIILIIAILFGSGMYYIEMNVPGTEFTSIPMSMWWALQTVLCLGYGDIVPTTAIGKIVGAFMLYHGVVIVMVLVLALGGRFFDMYAKIVKLESFLPEEKQEDYEIHYQ